ncbi:Lysophosphatidic acid:oleoyl-CoA acyltransferase 1 [Entomophthora muscae]|uniref:Lysophosphatidic acid:oleoyl-CoA acyltransferase 1 n=2 Tax=Entomophthora muscae TaxID=34485 RepID=A0ACC2TNT9_9FUNG|nr:Lysophosphatidic acid:oleoyl-CoA acyltransferase 1 [Entomophthora muscae]
MEKYSKWRDPGTGIAPFLPIVPPKIDKRGSFTVYLFIKRFILGPLLAILRTPLLLITGLIAFAVYGLGIVIPGSFMEGWLLAGVLRLGLFIAGFYWIPMKPGSLKRGLQSSSSSSPRDGDVIFCNSSSYIDIFILQIKFNPIFTMVHPETGKVREASIACLLKSYASVSPSDEEAFQEHTLASFSKICAKEKRGPVVVFFEGTPTNGRGLLSPVAGLFEGFSSSFFLVHIRYPSVHFSPTFPVGSMFWHILGICSQINNSAVLRIVSSPEVQCNLKPNEPMANQMVSLFARMSGLRSMSLNIKDKCSFVEYYYSNSSPKKAQ